MSAGMGLLGLELPGCVEDVENKKEKERRIPETLSLRTVLSRRPRFGLS